MTNFDANTLVPQALPPMSADTATVPEMALTAAVGAPPSAPVTINDLDTAISEANTAYISSRRNAATAAATVLFVWTHACSDIATPQNKSWYTGELAKREKANEAHNQLIEQQKASARKSMKERVNLLKEERRKANSEERKSELDDQIKNLQEDVAERVKQISAQRKVKLEARVDAGAFTEITKFVLMLDAPSQASQISRFAKVAKWLTTKFVAPSARLISVMAERILQAGGFDAVYEEQRLLDLDLRKPPRPETPLEAKADNTTSDAVIEHFEQVVAAAKGISVPALRKPGGSDGMIALIARRKSGETTVISEIAVPTVEMLRLCVDYNDRALLPGDANAEFVANALAAGELVEEGKRLANDNGALEATRVLSIVADDSDARFVVSARGAEASVVVHAIPKDAVAALFAKRGYWLLHSPEIETLQKRLADATERKMMTLSLCTQEREIGEDSLLSDLAWLSTDKPLQLKGDAKAVLAHAWLPMSPHADSPLDVDGFEPLGTVTLSNDQLDKLVNGHIGKWKGVKADNRAGNKPTNVVKVTITKSQLTISTNSGDDAVLLAGNMKSKATLFFRPRPLSKLVNKLAELKVASVKLSPDDRGALRASFEDEYGTYAIYLPSCKESGAPLTARFHKIRVPEIVEA